MAVAGSAGGLKLFCILANGGNQLSAMIRGQKGVRGSIFEGAFPTDDPNLG